MLQALQAKVAGLSQQLEAARDSEAQLQDEIMSLTEQRKKLHSENVNLSGEVRRCLSRMCGCSGSGCLQVCVLHAACLTTKHLLTPGL